jgi:hypothetical protein
MDVITPVIAVFALFVALICRGMDETKKEDKRVRIAKRTNTKVWNRARRDWVRK